MSNESENERIDLTELEEQFKDGLNWDDMDTMDLIDELKRMYEEINKLASCVKNAWNDEANELAAKAHVLDSSISDLQRLRIYDEVVLIAVNEFLQNNASK